MAGDFWCNRPHPLLLYTDGWFGGEVGEFHIPQPIFLPFFLDGFPLESLSLNEAILFFVVYMCSNHDVLLS